jgi:hypothetical protein
MKKLDKEVKEWKNEVGLWFKKAMDVKEATQEGFEVMLFAMSFIC